MSPPRAGSSTRKRRAPPQGSQSYNIEYNQIGNGYDIVPNISQRARNDAYAKRVKSHQHASINNDELFALLTFPGTHLTHQHFSITKMDMHLFFFLLAASSVFASSFPHPPEYPWCKPTYGSPNWPSPDAWHRLNETVSGRLVTPTPPGAVCHASFTEYDNATCSLVARQWSNTTFHALNLVSADYNDVACLPNSKYPCSVDRYPRFVIPALNAQDVQHAVSFARETGVRLIVKGTGHDVPGRYASVRTHTVCLVLIETGHPGPMPCLSRHTTCEV